MLSWANLFELNKSVIYFRPSSNHSIRSQPSDKTALYPQTKILQVSRKSMQKYKCFVVIQGSLRPKWCFTFYFEMFLLLKLCKIYCFEKNVIYSCHFMFQSLSSYSWTALSLGCPILLLEGQRPAEFNSNLLKQWPESF